ncbi:hypothetical protein [Paenibacillus jiagnxiensis]|uniref:hypothetical protein n=1 Tax=Paenibacillus jiagnxiensis TaxID=3228926 RepID=UPI0033A83523
MTKKQVAAAQRALNKKIEELIPAAELDGVDFGIDKETETTYHWFFTWEDKDYEFIYRLSTKNVEVIQKPARKELFRRVFQR